MPFPRSVRAPHMLLCAAALIGLSAVACRDRPDVPDVRQTAAMQPFGSLFELVDSIRLRQQPRLPIGRISGLARAADGRIVIADPMDARVQIFGADGAFLRALGGPGDGPGEFRIPVAPRIDAGGRLHVTDVGRRQIAVFSLDGALLRTIRLPDLVRIDGVALGAAGSYHIVGRARGAREDVLLHVDSAGAVVRSALAHQTARPAGQPDDATWQTVRRASVARAGGQVLVASTLLDSLWSVRMGDYSVAAEPIPVPGYTPPSLPDRPLRTPTERRTWTASLQLAAYVIATDSMAFVPFVRGTYFDGAPGVLAYRGPTGQWAVLSSAPPLLATSGEEVIALLTPADTQVVLGVYRRR